MHKIRGYEIEEIEQTLGEDEDWIDLGKDFRPDTRLKTAESNEIAAQVAEYLARGGKIQGAE